MLISGLGHSVPIKPSTVNIHHSFLQVKEYFEFPVYFSAASIRSYNNGMDGVRRTSVRAILENMSVRLL